jgi:hypothetical protein
MECSFLAQFIAKYKCPHIRRAFFLALTTLFLYLKHKNK